MKLSELRKRQHLTQVELAEKADLDLRTVGAIEQGRERHLSPKTARALADALGLAFIEDIDEVQATIELELPNKEKGANL